MLYDIGWGPFGPHCVFENYTAFCNKIGTQIKLTVFFQIVKKIKVNYFQKIGYGLFYNHKLTLLINRLTRKSIINTSIVSVVLPVSTHLRQGVKSAWGKLVA